jgi:hypothetical protein
LCSMGLGRRCPAKGSSLDTIEFDPMTDSVT